MSETSFWPQGLRGLIGFMGDAYTVIQRSEATWGSPVASREIATSGSALLAMTTHPANRHPHQNPVRDIALLPWSKGLMVPKNQDEVSEERPSDQRDRGTNRLTDERTSRGQYRFVVFVISSLLSSPPHESNYGTEYGCSTLRGKRSKQKNGYIYEKSFTLSIGCRTDDTYSLGTRVAATSCMEWL